MRVSVLNSKSGFKRSGIPRLILKKKPGGEEVGRTKMDGEERDLVEEPERQGEKQMWRNTQRRRGVQRSWETKTAEKRNGEDLNPRPRKTKNTHGLSSDKP